jgi:hypothetical protein
MLGSRITHGPARLSLLLLAFLLSSCGPAIHLKTPLSALDQAKPDERLVGIWKPQPKEKEKDTNQFLLFIGKVDVPNFPPGIMKAVVIGFDTKNHLGDVPLFFFPTSAGADTYANLLELNEGEALDRGRNPTWDKRKIRGFAIYKYQVEKDQLTIWQMANNAVQTAVQKGQVKGNLEKKGSQVTAINLTDGEDLLRFLTSGGDRMLFADDAKTVFSWHKLK